MPATKYIIWLCAQLYINSCVNIIRSRTSECREMRGTYIHADGCCGMESPLSLIVTFSNKKDNASMTMALVRCI